MRIKSYIKSELSFVDISVCLPPLTSVFRYQQQTSQTSMLQYLSVSFTLKMESPQFILSAASKNVLCPLETKCLNTHWSVSTSDQSEGIKNKLQHLYIRTQLSIKYRKQRPLFWNYKQWYLQFKAKTRLILKKKSFCVHIYSFLLTCRRHSEVSPSFCFFFFFFFLALSTTYRRQTSFNILN